MDIYRIIITVLETLFLMLVSYALYQERESKLAWFFYLYIWVTGIGCLVGMWIK